MAYPIKVKDYAKKLFLTISKEGQHKFSEDDIVEEISREFPDLPKFPDRRTINNWINTKDKESKKTWKNLWDRGVRHGIQNAAREHLEDIEGEEEIDINIDTVISLRAGNAIKVQKQISEKLEAGHSLDKEDVRAWRASEYTFNNLNLEAKADEDDPFDIDYDYLDDVVENE